MNPIQQTIEKIDGKISALQSLRESLCQLFAEDQQEAPAAAKQETKRRVVLKTNGTPTPSRLDPEILRRAANLPTEFAPRHLSAAGLGLGNMERWKKRGWIKQAGAGTWTKTPQFPLAGLVAPMAPPAPRVTIPGLDENRGSIEEQLEKALKDRDTARANGQERLERILQDKVNKLQDQLK